MSTTGSTAEAIPDPACRRPAEAMWMPAGSAAGARRLAAAISATALTAALAATAALAREAETLFDLPLEDLLQVEIRAAGKREEQIRDIPASVTIITRDET